MNNEPVAYWDGKEPNVLGLAYHQNDYCFIPLYTHQVKEQELLDEIARLGKENTKWRKWCDLLLKDIAPDDLPTCKHGVDDGACKECYIEVTHPAELTDEEKWKLWSECPNGLVYDRVMMFADLILRKAQEK